MKATKYNNLTDLWKHVVSGTDEFKIYQGNKNFDHERRFLQALHSKDALNLMAETLSGGFRPVTVASAFIDGQPLFNWKGGSGEIADILVLVNRTDHKDNKILGSLVQAKVTPSHTELDSHPSTLGQLILYATWPEVTFKRKVDQYALELADMKISYDLKNGGDKWPFPFLKICTIANPDQSKNPTWVFGDLKNQEPYYVTGKISQSDANVGHTFTEWLMHSADFCGPYTHFEAMTGNGHNPNFVSFVNGLTVVLRERQKENKLGQSNGQLIHESIGSVIFNEFGTSAKVFNKFEYNYKGNFTPDYNHNDFNENEEAEVAEPTKPFLVLYIEFGPEGMPKQKVTSNNLYPGTNILFS